MRYEGKPEPKWSWRKVIWGAIIVALILLLAGPVVYATIGVYRTCRTTTTPSLSIVVVQSSVRTCGEDSSRFIGVGIASRVCSKARRLIVHVGCLLLGQTVHLMPSGDMSYRTRIVGRCMLSGRWIATDQICL